MIYLSLIFLLYMAYQIFFYFIACTGIKGSEKKRMVSFAPIEKMLVIIPAHNEQNVISNLINDLKTQTVSCDILVLADHCTDQTVSISKSLGASVYIRDSGLPGKQFAIRELFHSMKDQSQYDSYSILDADNRVDSDYVKKTLDALKNHNVVQSYLDVVDSNNWVAKGYEINYRIMNGTLQRARQLFGLTAFLGGTGWASRWSVVEQVPFLCSSLTDDLEYSILLWIHGYRVEYLEHIKIYDEKPRNIKSSYVQRLRWMRGGFQVLFKYFRPILFQGFFFRRFSFFDLIGVLSLYVVGAINCLIITASILGVSSLHFSFVSYFLFQSLYLGIYLLVDSLSVFSLLVWIPAALLVNLVAIPLALHGLLTFNKKSWVRTEHFG